MLSAVGSPADPRTVVVGGAWGSRPRMIDAIEEHFRRTPRPVPVGAAAPPLPEPAGARARAAGELRSPLVRSARSATHHRPLSVPSPDSTGLP
ncbi:hypothetical protein GCM10010421_08270 [Streptomyces glaucus]|uniref:Uncharacterized protein n=1 Tax=Streptomyces glaucus TaxID=284029 RepID=A0ABN3J7X8_9ACTN